VEQKDFYPLMKVSLNGEYGIVTDQFFESSIVTDTEKSLIKSYGLIRWDTDRISDFEDWRGLWGTFVAMGGCEVDKGYQFQYIGDDGGLREE
jgi:hypothetical protein